MSKISLASNASGTGIFTLASPATNTNRTLTLPDSTGTLLDTNGGTITGTLTVTGVTTLGNGAVLGVPASGTATNLTGLPLTSGVTGTLPVANGGTNLTSFTSGGVVYASSGSALATGSALNYDGSKFDVIRATTTTTAFDEPVMRAINSGAATLNQRVDVALRFQDGTYNGIGGISMLRESATARSGALLFSPIGSDGNGTEKMRITSAGDVGIGTTSPSTKLQVVGTITAGASSTMSLYDSNLRQTGAGVLSIGTAGAGAIQFYNNDANTMQISATGNLGLGVTPSAWVSANPIKAIQVGRSGSISYDNGTASTTIVAGAYLSATNQWTKIGTTGSAKLALSDYDGSFYWSRAASGSGNFTYTDVMTLDSSGNLLVGNTAGTGYRLNVKAAFTTGIGGAYVEAGEYDKSIMVLNHTNAAVSVPLFQVQKSSTGVLTLDSSGNLGIGTTSPTSVLDVSGVISLQGTTLPSAGTARFFSRSSDSGLYIQSATGGVTYLLDGSQNTMYSVSPTSHLWSISNVTKMILDASGNLGIGTTSPAANLHISRTTAASVMISNTSTSLVTDDPMGVIDFSAGTANTVNARVSGLVVGTSEAGGSLVIETRADGGSLSEKVRITGAGNLGIGTTSPAYKIHAVKTDGGIIGRFDNADGVADIYGYGLEITRSNAYIKSSGVLHIGSSHGYSTIYIDTSGLVGIGTTDTATFGRKFLVNGTGGFNNDSGAVGIGFNRGSANTYGYIGTGDWAVNYLSNADFGISSGATGALVFGTAAGAERARIDTNGNLGIGTTSPGRKLEISTTLSGNPTGTGNVGSALRLSNLTEYESNYGTGGGNPDFLGSIEFYSGDGSTGTGVRTAIKTSVDAYYNEQSLRFYTSPVNAVGLTERMCIVSSGNVGIGTSTPGAKLDVTGDISIGNSADAATANFFNTNAGLTTQVIQSISVKAAGTDFTLYRGTSNSSVHVFNVFGNGNVTNTNNSYAGISDVKLKENIVDATPKLANLMQVKVRNYNLKSDPSFKQIGVIAQELETIFPTLVEETKDSDVKGNDLGTTTKSVKYSVFVPMLIKAMQEQQALITQLTARITALETA